MSTQDLLGKLSDVTRTKKGWSARCPSHPDTTASLTVSEGAKGTVLVNCHAGCKAGDVVKAVGLTLADLFPAGRSKESRSTSKKAKTKSKLAQPADMRAAMAGARKLAAAQMLGGASIRLHTYADASGAPLFWRIRCKSKAGEKWMRPMYFNGSGYVLGEPPSGPEGKPLYLLPLVADSDGPVVVVEGESCADALAELGIVATTSGGADSAAASDWSPLAGRPCIVWPDNDSPGAKYAAEVTERLRALGCSVELIDVDALGLPPKGDAVDWLQANGSATAAGVLALDRTEPPKTPQDVLFDSLGPLPPEVWVAAGEPHPHAFQDGHVGIFPVGEVTVIGSPGRTGKTTALVAIAARYLRGASLGGLHANKSGPVVVLSAEDSPTQFARKLGAAKHFIPAADWPKVEQGFIVPDFDAQTLAGLRQLVSLDHGQPAVAPEVTTIVNALRQYQAIHGVGLVIIETASTWNAANEDNPSFRALIAAAKQVARTLNVAVVLTHHVNQSSGINLSKLDISVADLRGGTTFVDNSRQVALLVNLGSDDNPFPDDDARTVLRHMVAPHVADKVSALVFLNSSQGDDVPPLFFQWVPTEHGPACVEIVSPASIQGRKWYALREMVKAARPLKAEGRRAAKVEEIVSIVRRLDKFGRHPTARAVSLEAGQHQSWATDALRVAQEQGLLRCAKEKVPRAAGKVDVYRPA